MKMKKKRALTYPEMVAFLCGFVFLNLGQIADQFGQYFMVDIAGIPATAAGAIITATTLVAAFGDPILGNFVDQTNTRWGKYRPFIMFCPIGSALFMVMRFFVPDMSVNGLIAYYTVTALLMTIFHNCAAVPMQAFKIVLTPDYDERNMLGSLGSVASTLIGALIGTILLKSVANLGGGEQGWFRFVVIAWSIGLLGAFVCQNGIKKKDRPGMIPTPPKKPMVTSIFRMFLNKPTMCIGLAMFFSTFVTMLTSNVQMFYYENVLHDTSVLAKTAAYGLPIQLVCLLLLPFFLRFFSKKQMLIIGFVLSVLRPATIMIMGESLTPNAVIVLILINRVGSAFFTPAISSWIPECADWTNLKEGAGSAALVSAMVSFLQKVARAIGSGAVGIVLGMSGYNPQAEITQESIDAILNLNGIYGVVALCIAMIPILLFPISKDEATEIREKLAERRAAEEKAANENAANE